MTKLDQLLSEILDDASLVADETPFATLPEWDSMKHVELVVGLETRYGVELAATDIAAMTSRSSALAVLAARGARD